MIPVLLANAQEGGDVVLIADIGGTNCRFELWKIDMSGQRKHVELFHQVSERSSGKQWQDLGSYHMS